FVSEEFVDYINSPSWNRLTFYNNDEEHSIHYKEYLENSSNAIATVLPTEEPEYSLSMGDEHLSAIPEMESDKLIKSSVENLVPISSESEVTSDNENTLFDSSPKFDYLKQFSSELMPTRIINEEGIKREHEEYITVMKKLLAINSFPRPLENFHAKTIIETLPTPLMPVEDSDSLREEIEIFTSTDDLMPPGIKSDDYDSEGKIHFLEELLSNDSILLPKNDSSDFDHHDEPPFPRPPPEPLDVENSSNAIATVLPTEEPEYSLSMGAGHLSTIPEMESDELIKSSVENLVPISSESEFTSDNENTLFDSSPKFDYLEQFSSELKPTRIINEEGIKREHEEYITVMKKLLTINSFPRPLENFHAKTIIETLPIPPIPVEDSDSLREEIEIFTSTDDLMPPGIKSDDYDSEGEIHFLEELLSNDSILLPENDSSDFDHHDEPPFPRPPPEPLDVE
nr:hypothetical protein [Tanacetum cinerariifolium]